MIGIKAIGRYIPDTKISNLERCAVAGKDAGFITDKIGFQSVTRKSADMETSDMCVAALDNLVESSGMDVAGVDCIVVCTQNPDAHGIPNTSSIVHRKLGLGSQLATFDISHGCSGYVYGLSIMKAFMEANGLKSGLLFTADPYSKIMDPKDWDTELLFGDGATVTWLGESPVYHCRPAMFGSDGSMGHSITVPQKNQPLEMLGSNVFKFTMTAVPAQIGEYLERESLDQESIDLFLLHQGSRFIVDNLARKLKLPAEKVPFEAADTGNTVSSSIPMMLASRMEAPLPRVMLCGFGVGLSWATMVIESE